MRKVTYSMSMSVDGYIAGPDGDFDWPGFTDDVFRISLDEIRTIGVHLMGRRLYETGFFARRVITPFSPAHRRPGPPREHLR